MDTNEPSGSGQLAKNILYFARALREAFAPTLNVAVIVDELTTTTLLTVTALA